MKVESDFFVEGSEAISIKNYTLTDITRRTLEIQVEFSYPRNITQSVLDPDSLVITFKNPLIFMDSLDYSQLATEEISISTSIQKQRSAEEVT